jgi:hypothetical protein
MKPGPTGECVDLSGPVQNRMLVRGHFEMLEWVEQNRDRSEHSERARVEHSEVQAPREDPHVRSSKLYASYASNLRPRALVGSGQDTLVSAV